MSKLIKNEITKIFKKKSLYITLLVILAFVILINVTYKYFFNNGSYSYYSEGYIAYVKSDLEKLDPNKPSDTKMYIEFKTILDTYDLYQKYGENSWQAQIINSNVASYLSERNTYLYGESKDEQKVKEINAKIDEIINKLNNDDWKYFANLELEKAKTTVEELEKAYNNTEDKQEKQTYKTELEAERVNLEVAQYRIDKNIKYGTDFMNTALSEYATHSKNIIYMDNSNQELKYAEKQERQNYIEQREINKYIIENNIDINKANDLSSIFKEFFNQYGLFIIVMVIMIAGTIVSEEFNKGTVKLLLVKPYSRNKILLSKFITVLFMIVFCILAVIVMQLIVGGIIFGFDSLSIPVLKYNFHTNTLQQMNIFQYLGISIVCKLPIIVLLATLAFAFSTLFTNSAVAIALPLLGYMGSEVINLLAVQYKVTFLKFFVTPNWDFTNYIFGKLPIMEGLTAGFSAIICIAYFIIMMIPTFMVFKRKNIKNI